MAFRSGGIYVDDEEGEFALVDAARASREHDAQSEGDIGALQGVLDAISQTVDTLLTRPTPGTTPDNARIRILMDGIEMLSSALNASLALAARSTYTPPPPSAVILPTDTVVDEAALVERVDVYEGRVATLEMQILVALGGIVCLVLGGTIAILVGVRKSQRHSNVVRINPPRKVSEEPPPSESYPSMRGDDTMTYAIDQAVPGAVFDAQHDTMGVVHAPTPPLDTNSDAHIARTLAPMGGWTDVHASAPSTRKLQRGTRMPPAEQSYPSPSGGSAQTESDERFVSVTFSSSAVNDAEPPTSALQSMGARVVRFLRAK